jgi:hypothetical protein
MKVVAAKIIKAIEGIKAKAELLSLLLSSMGATVFVFVVATSCLRILLLCGGLDKSNVQNSFE